MKAVWVAIGILVLAAGVVLIKSRNHLLAERAAYQTAFQQVDADLDRRLMLVPELVAIVQKFASREKDALRSIAAARTAMEAAHTAGDRIRANDELDTALARVLVATEAYPRLKASENFLRVRDDLADAENQIAVTRRQYDEAVTKYNVDIGLFPDNVAAAVFGYGHEDAYFSAAAH